MYDYVEQKGNLAGVFGQQSAIYSQLGPFNTAFQVRRPRACSFRLLQPVILTNVRGNRIMPHLFTIRLTTRAIKPQLGTTLRILHRALTLRRRPMRHKFMS